MPAFTLCLRAQPTPTAPRIPAGAERPPTTEPLTNPCPRRQPEALRLPLGALPGARLDRLPIVGRHLLHLELPCPLPAGLAWAGALSRLACLSLAGTSQLAAGSLYALTGVPQVSQCRAPGTPGRASSCRCLGPASLGLGLGEWGACGRLAAGASLKCEQGVPAPGRATSACGASPYDARRRQRRLKPSP